MYRMAAADIGCSLAEAAEAPAYDSYLGAAAGDASPALHVVYINTSLRTKALAHAQVPTITCTSSNVVQTVLQVRLCILQTTNPKITGVQTPETPKLNSSVADPHIQGTMGLVKF